MNEQTLSTQQKAPERPVRQLKTNKGLLKFILLSIITFGIYALVVEVEESEKYEYSKNWVVFSYVSTLPEADIEFTTKTVYDYTGEGIRPDFGVTPGVEYTYHYEQNGVYYQDDDPVEVGDYTLVIVVYTTLTTFPEIFVVGKVGESNRKVTKRSV